MILEVNNLNKSYGKGNNTVFPVKNVSLKVKEGQFIAIIGQSGSGKSSLMHILGGLDHPDSGTVLIDGTNLYELSEDEITIFRRRNIGFIYQFYNLIPVLTVKENIILPVVLDNKKVDYKYFNKLINKLNLKDRLKYLPNELSGGGQQRTAIARAMITRPKILLADEPTGNLDSRSTKTVLKMLKDFNKNYNQTIILVTHDLNVAKEADRIITYKDGQIKEDKSAHKNR